MLAKIRLALWGLVAVAIGLTLGVYVFRDGGGLTSVAERAGLVGGDFELVTTGGQPFGDDDLAGKPYAIFFGFTHCPDVCPTTLVEMAGWIEALGPDAAAMRFVFVTVDPERDTPEVLSDYVAAFSDAVVPLSGAPAEVERVTRLFRVYAARVELEGGDYTMDHTASVYLMDARGGFFGTLAFGEPAEAVVEKLKRLITVGGA